MAKLPDPNIIVLDAESRHIPAVVRFLDEEAYRLREFTNEELVPLLYEPQHFGLKLVFIQAETEIKLGAIIWNSQENIGTAGEGKVKYVHILLAKHATRNAKRMLVQVVNHEFKTNEDLEYLMITGLSRNKIWKWLSRLAYTEVYHMPRTTWDSWTGKLSEWWIIVIPHPKHVRIKKNRDVEGVECEQRWVLKTISTQTDAAGEHFLSAWKRYLQQGYLQLFKPRRSR